VDPVGLLGLTAEGQMLVDRLELLSSDLIILMPVRITTAKNIEFALEVVAELKKISSSPKLVLTGPPDPHDEQSMAYYASLLELRDDLGVKDEMYFVFEYGPEVNVGDEPYSINYDVVSQLYRLCDLVFMPSHREGFGMPVLEAGLVGVPVASTAIPAAEEIAAQEVLIIQSSDSPKRVAKGIIDLLEGNPISVLRRRIRREYTWEAIFHKQIVPLLHKQEAAR
jgi:glycosyltransferase involved in cell wall biosynthesis